MSVIDNDRPVSAYTESVIDYSERKEQVRQAVRRYRRRRQHGIYRRPIDVTDAQLDVLEERSYLDPERRGDRAAKAHAAAVTSRSGSRRSFASGRRRARWTKTCRTWRTWRRRSTSTFGSNSRASSLP
jgi:hypothetical protein